MRYLFNILLVFIIAFLVEAPSFAIKIGLAENAKESVVAVSSSGGIYDLNSGKEILALQPMSGYTLKNGKTSILVKINGKFYSLNSNKVYIKTYDTKGFVLAKKRWYRQNLIVEKRLTLINDINLELYLLGVVPSEMPSSWNIEAHKAQAIAARSYAIANMGKRALHGYDLKDTPEDQAYGGASAETQKTNRAVIDTKGQVLVNNNKVISAFYHASAGGHTVNSGQIWCRNLPYLRSVPSFDGNIPKKGHGVGMSQYGANNLANYGYNAYQILAYFYANVQLATIP